MSGRNKSGNGAGAEQALKSQLTAAQNKLSNLKKEVTRLQGGGARPTQASMSVGPVPSKAFAKLRATYGGQINPRAMSGDPVGLSPKEMDALWRALGDTDAGRDWALSALHPNHEESPPPLGIPDASQQPVVTPRYHNASVVAFPGTATAGATWDVQIVNLPIAEVDYIWRSRTSAAVAWSNWNVVYVSVFSQAADGTSVTLGSVGLNQVRAQSRGYTYYLECNDLNNQGMVFAGQIDAIEAPSEPISGVVLSPTTVSGNLPRYTQYFLPASSQSLVQMDNLATEWRADLGVYMPIRFNNTVSLYVSAVGGSTIAAADPSGSVLPQGFSAINAPTTGGGGGGVDTVVLPNPPTFTFPASAPAGLNGIIYGTSDAFNMLTGVTFFIGISQSATVQVKSRLAIEGKVSQGAPALQPFVHSAPLLDTTALDVVARVGQLQRHAYYASYNDLSKILRTVWNSLFSTLKWAGADMVGKLPVVGGGLAGIVNNLKNPVPGDTYF